MGSDRSERRYILFVVAVVLLGIAGYGVYLLYPRFNLPTVDAIGLAVLSLAAGAAAFFSPCSFPLLATLLIRETAGASENARNALGSALRYATALSAGVVLFLGVTAAIVAAGSGALVEQVTFASPTGRAIRLGIGILLIVLGLIQTERVRFPFHRAADLVRPLLQSQAQIRRRFPAAGFALFGFVYLVAGFG